MSASNSSFIMLLTAVLFSSCELYDLRPPEYNAAENPEDPKKARAIIDNCIEAHGWDEVDSPVIEVTYTDEWPSFLFRLFFHPWPSRHQKIKHQMIHGNLYTSRIIFQSGIKEGEIWGIKDYVSYVKRGDELYLKETDANFYLPTYQYFFQMPLWMKDIPFLDYLGEEESNGQKYHKIFGTWKTAEPQKDYDQYIFWINSETYLLEMVQYTIREQMASAHGANTFSDFRKVGDVTVPFIQVISFEPGDGQVLHKIVIEEVVLASGLEEKALIPTNLF